MLPIEALDNDVTPVDPVNNTIIPVTVPGEEGSEQTSRTNSSSDYMTADTTSDHDEIDNREGEENVEEEGDEDDNGEDDNDEDDNGEDEEDGYHDLDDDDLGGDGTPKNEQSPGSVEYGITPISQWKSGDEGTEIENDGTEIGNEGSKRPDEGTDRVAAASNVEVVDSEITRLTVQDGGNGVGKEQIRIIGNYDHLIFSRLCRNGCNIPTFEFRFLMRF